MNHQRNDLPNQSITYGAAYYRFSSDNQREESIEAQMRAVHEYAERNGIVIVSEYTDRAKSAVSDQRPEFQRMITDSANGSFTVAIVHKLDRFSRDRYDSAYYKRTLKRNGVSLLSVTENLDGSPESIIMESVLEGMAEYYSKNLAREVMKGMKENAYQGKHTGGIPPLGYDVDKESKTYIINEHEANAVRLIFARVLEHVGYGTIIDELNEKGYRSKNGQLFGKNSLHDILKNQKYCGTFVFNKRYGRNVDGKRNMHKFRDESEMIIVPEAIPAIVSKEDFDVVQNILKKRTQTRKHSHAKETFF